MDQPKESKKIMSDMQPVRRSVVNVQKESLIRSPRKVVEPVEYLRPTTNNFQTTRKKNIPLWTIGIICAGLITVTIGGLWSQAHITLEPWSYSGQVDTVMSLSQVKTEGSVHMASATRTFTEEIIVPKTGVTNRQSFASGTVRFYNSGSKAELIPAHTTLLSSSNFQYTIDRSTTVPAMKKGVPGQSDVKIISKNSGAMYNINPDDFTFQSLVRDSLTIRSVTALSGGIEETDAVADPEQITQATAKLESSFPDTEALIARMSEEVPDTMLVLPIIFPQATAGVSLDAAHEDGVHVIGSKNVSILLVNRSEFARAIGNTLSVNPSITLTMNTFEGLTMTTDALGSGVNLPVALRVRITGNALLASSIDPEKIHEIAPALSRADLKKNILKIPEIKSYVLRMTPFWRRTLPTKMSDIKVIIE